MNKPIIINIDWYKIIIEKDDNIKTAPIHNHPIKYNPISIKRKYYNKSDPEYHRKSTKPRCKIPKPISTSLKSDKIVIQEPLLDFHYQL